jgi:hypothetical protein
MNNEEIFKSGYEEDAKFNLDVLQKQASIVYYLALDAFEGNTPNMQKDDYHLLMGIANMLFHIRDGSLKVTEVRDYTNTGVY